MTEITQAESKTGIVHPVGPSYPPREGPVSEGTLRPEDLIPVFARKLRNLTHSHATQGLLSDADLAQHPEVNAQFIAEVFYDLMDSLNEYAPKGLQFGAHEGDRACFGWWAEEPEPEPTPEYEHEDWLEDLK